MALAACGEPTSAPQQAQSSQLPAQQPQFTAAHPVYGSLFASPGEHVHILPLKAEGSALRAA